MESLVNRRSTIPVSMALETLYCPRNFYLRYVTGETSRDYRMQRGKGEDERRNRRKRVAKPDGYRAHDISLSSVELGLAGKVDAIDEIDGVPYPVEFKTGSVTENEYDRAQLCAYGMMLEEMRSKRIPRGYIYYRADRQKVEVPFTGELRALVRQAVDTAWAILEGSLVPPPRDDPRCRGCALADICMPDETRIISGKKDQCPAGVAPRSTFERTVFIDESWGSVGKSGGRMVIRKGRDTVGEVPLETFDQLFLVGKINLSGALLSDLFKRDIYTAFFTSFGRFEGALTPEKSKHSALRIQQVKSSISENRRLGISRGIVHSKLINMRVLLRRALARNHSETLAQSVARIAALRKQIDACQTLDQLLGIEGAGSRAYFDGFKTLFRDQWGFSSRTRRPPRDPVNAALSFGYSILTGQVTGLINAVGMDPYIGFLHRVHYGNPCLALDLVEAFRPIVIDSVVLRLFHQKMLKETCFTKPEKVSNAVYLNEKGRKAFFKAFSSRMRERATHPVFNKKLSYRRLIEMDIRFFAKFLCGEFDAFKPYTVR